MPPSRDDAIELRASRRQPVAMLLALGVVWGAGFSVSKLAVISGVPPIGVSFWQCTGAAVLVTLFNLWRGRDVPLSTAYVLFCAVTGVVFLALPVTLSFMVLAHVPAGIVAVIIATVPLVTYGVSVAGGLESVQWRRISGIAFGFAGAMFILAPRSQLPTTDILWWTAFAFAVPLLYGVGNVYVARARPEKVTPTALTAGMLVAAGIGLAPVALFTGSLYPLWPPFGTAELAVLCQMAIASTGYVLFFELMRIAGPVYVSQVGFVATVTGLWWASWIHDERYSIWTWIAVALILGGLALAGWRRGGRARTAASD